MSKDQSEIISSPNMGPEPKKVMRCLTCGEIDESYSAYCKNCGRSLHTIEEMKFIALTKEQRIILLKALGYYPEKLTCRYCKEKIKDVYCSIMPALRGDVEIAVILCDSPMCLCEYFDDVENEVKPIQKRETVGSAVPLKVSFPPTTNWWKQARGKLEEAGLDTGLLDLCEKHHFTEKQAQKDKFVKILDSLNIRLQFINKGLTEKKYAIRCSIAEEINKAKEAVSK